jgi:hypothetical protein
MERSRNKTAYAKLQRQRFRLAALRVGSPFSSLSGPGMPDMRAQKLSRLAASDLLGLLEVTGAFKLLPVCALYFARPFAVRPAPLSVERFSPRPSDRETFLSIKTVYQ